MATRKLKLFLLFGIALSACDIVYVPQTLPIDVNDGAGATTQTKFSIDLKPLTREVARDANLKRWERFVVVPDNASASGTSLLAEAGVVDEVLPALGGIPPYKIGRGDVISFSRIETGVREDGRFAEVLTNSDFVVANDGKIFVPELGSFTVEGKTIEELRLEFEERFATRISTNSQVDTLPLPPVGKRPVYRIGAGDVLALTQFIPQITETGEFIDVPQTRPLTVTSNGVVSILGVGEVSVEGLSTDDALAALSSALLRAGLNPEIELAIRNNNSSPIRILGEVKLPASQRLIPISDAPVTLFDLVVGMGFQSVPGRQYNIRIRRGDQVYGISVDKLLTEFEDNIIYLHQGDVVFVEAVFGQPQFELDVTKFASSKILISSTSGLGVNKERIITAEPLTLGEVLIENGVTVDRFGEVMVRLIRDGREFRISARRLLVDQPERDIYLLPNDRIVLDPLYFEAQSAMIAGAGTVPTQISLSQKERLSLADAVFSSGALENIQSDLKQVFLLRRDHAAVDTFDAFHLDLSNPARLSLANEIQLRPDDIVFVSTQPISELNTVLSNLLSPLSLIGQLLVGQTTTQGSSTEP